MEDKEIWWLSNFLRRMHIAHYIDSSSIHITGDVVYIEVAEPLRIQIRQENGSSLMLLKDKDKVELQAWSNFGSSNYVIQFNKPEVIYHNGELIIKLPE
jgi:hypothetical protein